MILIHKCLLALAIASGLATVGASVAEETPLTPADVELRRTPGPDARFRYFPNEARQKQIEGRATVVCRIQPDGTLADCATKAESPEGQGFGEATQRLAAAEIKVAKTARDKSPTAGRLFQFTRLWLVRDRRDTAQVMPLDPGKVDEDGLRRRWIRPPDASAYVACFSRALGGQAEDAKLKLVCRSAAEDRLASCRVVENSRAPDVRYEAAALCAIETARFRVEDKDGRPVTDAEVTLPVGYRKP